MLRTIQKAAVVSVCLVCGPPLSAMPLIPDDSAKDIWIGDVKLAAHWTQRIDQTPDESYERQLPFSKERLDSVALTILDSMVAYQFVPEPVGEEVSFRNNQVPDWREAIAIVPTAPVSDFELPLGLEMGVESARTSLDAVISSSQEALVAFDYKMYFDNEGYLTPDSTGRPVNGMRVLP